MLKQCIQCGKDFKVAQSEGHLRARCSQKCRIESVAVPVGQKFGRLTVLGYAGLAVGRKGGARESTWLCRCDCGTEKAFYHYNVKSGNTTSCGCLQLEMRRAAMTTHGKSKGNPSEYSVWKLMRNRVNSEGATGYENYGGRGIRICKEWDSFDQFLADMGPRPGPDYSIDRIDNDGNYEPGNCRWATRAVQARNTRQNHFITFGGKTQCLEDWSSEVGIGVPTLIRRLGYGWDLAEVLRRPTKTDITFNGKTQGIRAWAKECGIAYVTIWRRIRAGWPLETALTAPTWARVEGKKTR